MALLMLRNLGVNIEDNLRKDLWQTGVQAHHLNQDATFRSLMPSLQELALGLRGNAFTDVGSPYNAHEIMERF